MNTSITILLLALTLLLTSETLLAQPQPLRFDRLDKTDGLAGSSVHTIVQDHSGFMWFGTSEGLSRFDGYTFKNYNHDPADSTTLSDDYIGALLHDESGTLWVGTSMGLNRYDPVTGSFVHFFPGSDTSDVPSNNINVLYESEDSSIWIGTQGGLFRFDKSANTFEPYRHDPDDPTSLSYDRVQAIFEDRVGALWVGTGEYVESSSSGSGGLNRLDRESGKFKRYMHDPNDPNSLIDNEILTVFEDRAGMLWVGTRRDGLFRYDAVNDGLRRFIYTENTANSILWSFEGIFRNPGVTVLIEDSEKYFWLGTLGGLYSYDREAQTFSSYKYDPIDSGSLSSDNIYSLFKDRNGVLWIGTDRGLSRLSRSSNPFRQYRYDPGKPYSLSYDHVWSVWEDHTGMLWAGTTEDGLNRIDLKTGIVTPFRNDSKDHSSLAHNNVNYLYEDRTGNLWVGTFGGGLDRFDRESETFDHYAHDPEDPLVRRDSFVTAIVEDMQGVIWVGTLAGLNRLDSERKILIRYPSDLTEGRSSNPWNVNVLYVDNGGDLWVCGQSPGLGIGIRKVEREINSFTLIVEGTSCSSMIEDRTGSLWFTKSTGNSGLNRIDPNTNQVTSYTVADGLPSNSVMGVLEDEHGFLWIGTFDAGISRFDPKTETFRNYGTADGLQATRFSWDAYHKSQSGEMFFGGPAGITAFYPDEVVDNPQPPELHLMQVRVNGESLYPEYDGPVGDLLPESEGLRLPHTQNDVAIEYVGLHYSRSERNRYAYMLEGLDSDWRDVGGLRRADFPGLSPGYYTFRVKAANSDGVWSEVVSLPVRILPPWWRTGWAYAVYGLVVIAGLVGLQRYQRRQLLRKARQKARERELAHAREIEDAYHQLEKTHTTLKTTQQKLVQSEKMASLGQLTAGIAHEIKNPLNFVNNFGQINEELANDLSEQLEANSDKKIGDLKRELQDVISSFKTNSRQIVKHGKRADQIVQSMMQHARQSEGDRYLVEVNPFVDKCVNVSYHGRKAQLPDFQMMIEREFDERVGTLEIAPQEMSRVMQNLLNNAFEAVQDKAESVNGAYEPRVSVSTLSKENGVEIRVCDNGLGIPDALQKRVFEPFFTTKPTGSGTGLGLSISYDIVVKGHGGSLTVESEEGKGATFVITLPSRGE